jgi:hypothetical protein
MSSESAIFINSLRSSLERAPQVSSVIQCPPLSTKAWSSAERGFDAGVGVSVGLEAEATGVADIIAPAAASGVDAVAGALVAEAAGAYDREAEELDFEPDRFARWHIRITKTRIRPKPIARHWPLVGDATRLGTVCFSFGIGGGATRPETVCSSLGSGGGSAPASPMRCRFASANF